MINLWALNIALLFWIVLIMIVLEYKGLLIPLLSGVGIDMGVLL